MRLVGNCRSAVNVREEDRTSFGEYAVSVSEPVEERLPKSGDGAGRTRKLRFRKRHF